VTRRRAPALLALPAIVALLLLLLPLLGLVVRAPWGHLGASLSGSGAGQALRLSLETGVVSTLACLVLGVPLAIVLARMSGLPHRVLRALVTVPLVLPPVAGGIALLLAFGRRGVVGGPVFDATGLSLPFHTPAVVIAQTFVALPFLVLAVEGALRSSDRRYEEVAATLGAGRAHVLRHVTLPLVAPGIASGAALAFARAIGEFGATVTFAGSFPRTTQTVPLTIALLQVDDLDAAVGLSLILLVVSVAVLVLLRGRWMTGG